MNKTISIRVIEIDEAIYQLQLILNHDFYVTGEIYLYITNKINELKTEKQKLYGIQTIPTPDH